MAKSTFHSTWITLGLVLGSMGGSCQPYEECDKDHDGFCADAGQCDGGNAIDCDCDDDNPAISPDAEEVCDNVDNDCNGVLDDIQAGGAVFFADADGDGFGDPGQSTRVCDPENLNTEGYVENADDCNDQDPLVFLGAQEICDGVDNDCDSLIDEDGESEYFVDADGDGFGDPGNSIVSCQPGVGYVSNDDDCDDGQPSAFPDAPELCDGVDNDCDVDIDEGAACDPCGATPGDSTCLACMKSMCCMDYEACEQDPACAECLAHILAGEPHQDTCYGTAAGSTLYYQCAAGQGSGVCNDECPIQY